MIVALAPFELDAKMREPPDRHSGCGNASQSQAAQDLPVDRIVETVDGRTADLGQTRIEQVGADRGRGMNAKEQHQKRRHQRAAADAGEADQKTNRQPGNGVQWIEIVHQGRGSPALPNEVINSIKFVN